MDNFSGLKGYEREKNKEGGFGVFKGKVICKINYGRIETNDGSRNEELKGVDFFNYELEIINHDSLTGRRIWKRFNLDNEDNQRKLANTFFTLGLEFNNKEELLNAAEKFVEMVVAVSAWGWAPDEDDIDDETGKPRKRQMHKIVGIVDDSEKAENPGGGTEF